MYVDSIQNYHPQLTLELSPVRLGRIGNKTNPRMQHSEVDLKSAMLLFVSYHKGEREYLGTQSC